MSAVGVEFLIAGVQKGGTSALFEYLRDMPGLQLPAVKEIHFFDDEEIDWRRPDYARYHAHFRADGRIWGEATPIYTYWPHALERIATYHPAMRLIVLFRDPVQRAWSHWKMEYAKGKETQPFQWCIREGRARVTTGDPTAPGHHRVFSYVERGFYGRQVERILALFPREQCLFMTSEHLRDAPATALAQVCAFLGQPLPDAVTARLVHIGADIAYPSRLETADSALLTDLYAADLHKFSDLTGIDRKEWAMNRS